MKFSLHSAKQFFEPNDKMIKVLKELGFIFKKNGNEFHKTPHFYLDNSSEIEINTFDELMALIEKVGQLIVSKNSIWIYNDYME